MLSRGLLFWPITRGTCFCRLTLVCRNNNPYCGVACSATILMLILIGSLPTWPYSGGRGYYPSGGFGLLLVIHIIILLALGRI